MGLIFKSSRKAVCLALLLLLTSFGWGLPAQAGGFAMSGSFYAQEFELPQGSSLSSPDVYIVVFNHTDGDLNVRMTPQTPFGVKLILSEDDFPLEAGKQNKVGIGVEVGQEAIPGEYKVGITAEPYTKGATGIQIVGAAGQEAKLTITGEAASVEITSVSPDGEPVPAMIRLYRQTESQTFDIGFSETGSLKVAVSPGSYETSAYVAGKQVAEESFDISTDEEKEIRLTVKTVYFEGFGIVPNYRKGTEELAMVKIVYAVNNLLQAFPSAEVRLRVSHDGAPLEEATLVNLSPLEKGKIELSYNYIPSEGWEQGVYRFKLELDIGGEVYTASPDKELNIGGEADIAPSGKEKEVAVTAEPVVSMSAGKSVDGSIVNALNWPLIAGIAGGVVLLVIIITVLVRRRSYY